MTVLGNELRLIRQAHAIVSYDELPKTYLNLMDNVPTLASFP